MAIRTDHTAKMRVRKGDSVQVISGKDRGVTGKVILTLPKENRVLVEGVNRIKKHTKVTTTQRGAQSGGIVTAGGSGPRQQRHGGLPQVRQALAARLRARRPTPTSGPARCAPARSASASAAAMNSKTSSREF